MKAKGTLIFVLALGAFLAALGAGCADAARPANSAQNQVSAAPSAETVTPAAASNKDGGGGW